MAIIETKLQNFTVFEDISINFYEGINVIIGENGTGKTQLLKVMYLFMHNLGEGFGETKFRDIFMADSQDVIRNKNKGEARFSCAIDGIKERLTTYAISISGEILPTFGGKVDPYKKELNSIFIPVKEMLSHSSGFLAMNEKYKIPFDKTLIDIIVNAELPETRDVPVISRNILEILSDIIEGEVIYEKDTFYVKKKNGAKIVFSLESEGLRKIGLLWKLIRNGLLEKGTIIFWDEPEANLNPQLIPVLVDILLELQRNGVQIFIATHDYNLAKYFEVKRKAGDKVLYHSLFKTDNGVKSQSNEYFGRLQENPIIEADEKLLDEVFDKNLGD